MATLKLGDFVSFDRENDNEKQGVIVGFHPQNHLAEGSPSLVQVSTGDIRFGDFILDAAEITVLFPA